MAYVFVKSAAGWVNASETAKLRAPISRPLASLIGSEFRLTRLWQAALQLGLTMSREAPFGVGDSTETAKLTSTNNPVDEVAISGDTIVAATALEAAAFVRPPSGWASASETARLTASDPQTFASSVALSGDTVVVGSDVGAAVVGSHLRLGDAMDTARSTNSDARDLHAVAVSGDTIVVLGRQSADVYVKPPTGWADATPTARLTNSEGAGMSGVAIFANTFVTTAPDARRRSWSRLRVRRAVVARMARRN